MLSKAVGYDAAKPIKAGKVHLLVDTLGLVMVVVVRAARVPEQGEARMVFAAFGIVFCVCCGFGRMGFCLLGVTDLPLDCACGALS